MSCAGCPRRPTARKRPASRRRRTSTGMQQRGANTGRVTAASARSDVRAIATVVRPADAVSANPTAIGRRGRLFNHQAASRRVSTGHYRTSAVRERSVFIRRTYDNRR
jgi:hypothetical protein